jgi:transcriptional regulator with XRE-family HTH domain
MLGGAAPWFGALAAALLAELRRRRERGDCTTASLARRTMYSQPQIWRLLAGQRAITLESADALMLGAGITAAELVAAAAPRREPLMEPRPERAGYGVRLGRGPVMHVHRE